MELFTRTDSGIELRLSRDIRKFVAGLAEAVLLGTRDGTHPFAHRLAQPITVTKDEDDPFLVLARHDVIATAAQTMVETAWADVISPEQAEAWFETLQVGSQALAGSLHVVVVQDLDRLDGDDRERLSLIQFLLQTLVDVLDEPLSFDEDLQS